MVLVQTAGTDYVELCTQKSLKKRKLQEHKVFQVWHQGSSRIIKAYNTFVKPMEIYHQTWSGKVRIFGQRFTENRWPNWNSKANWDSAPDLARRIGLDTDDNNLIDSFEIAAWSVPVQVPWQDFSVWPQRHCHDGMIWGLIWIDVVRICKGNHPKMVLFQVSHYLVWHMDCNWKAIQTNCSYAPIYLVFSTDAGLYSHLSVAQASFILPIVSGWILMTSKDAAINEQC